MIKEQNKVFIKVQLISDLFLVTVSFFIGYLMRNEIVHIYPFMLLKDYLKAETLGQISYYIVYIGLLPVLLVIWGGLLSYFGMYKSVGVTRITEALFIIFKTTVVGFILFGSYVFILRIQHDVSRLFIGFTFVISAVLISCEKILLVFAFKAVRKRNKRFKSTLLVFTRALVVGTNKRAKYFLKQINANPDLGIKVVGIVDLIPDHKGELIYGHKIIGSINDIPEIITKEVIDEIVFIVPRSWITKIEEIMLYCESAGLKVNLAVDLFDLKLSKARQTDIFGLPLLTFESTTPRFGHLFIKRTFDFIISVIGLLILMPLFLTIMILIKSTSEGPVFFKQLRCGLFGRQFEFYKFRTMIANAESMLKDLLIYNEMEGPAFKLQNDPRVTRVGKWLRKFSLDELPQLWNVIKGDMSLVGPRPPLPFEVEKYDIWQRRKLSMRPGMTCLWQISGRNIITDFKEWMRLDLKYIDEWSLWLDVKILFKTIPAVLFGVGAK